jgi:D-tagatose-1,6-bisphosphate aldolase subunit GatZ/KbaZ
MSPLIQKLITRNRGGDPIGLPCFCTSNEHVLRAILAFTGKYDLPAVIEATCNQVNQDGGYTGMTPSDFISWLTKMAQEAGVPMSNLILGGDHLGPNPWRSEPLEQAMKKARELVKLFVESGFTKIHLDASMACGGEPNPSFEKIAERTADLCTVAERFAPDPSALVYVIGTEVPIPGGEKEEPELLDVTSEDRLMATVETHRQAFNAAGIENAWRRIVAVVTQPGVDFGHSSVFPFVPEKANHLSHAILSLPNLTFEAHSTDYQSSGALHALVQAHFLFLKVGPELTFRFREAVWALAEIEKQLRLENPSDIRNILEQRMLVYPTNWEEYYSGSDAEMARLRVFSYSDRIRYYWSDKVVCQALDRLLTNLKDMPLPETLVSQAFMGFEFGKIPPLANQLMQDHINLCVSRYFHACGFSF